MIYAVQLQCTDYDGRCLALIAAESHNEAKEKAELYLYKHAEYNSKAVKVEAIDLSKGPALFWVEGEVE